MKGFFTLKRIFFLTLVALMLSGAAVFLANDAFALTADGGKTEIVIPQGANGEDAAKILKENGLIRSKTWFKLYNRLRGRELKVKSGTFAVPNGSGFDGIVRILSGEGQSARTEVRVVIPEGSTVRGIVGICEELGLSSHADFTNEALCGDYSRYEFISPPAGAIEGVSPLSRFEGYLYPDTYYFYSDATASDIICTMLDNFAVKVDRRYLDACREVGMTLDEAVTLGSVIMREGSGVSDYGRISSVFHNRLKSSRFSGRLQSDATLVYALGREMSASDKALESPYNTYKYGGLPPTPICCPDLNAISHAICPDKTDYFYFVTGRLGTLFARDYHTHQGNIEAQRRAEK